MDELTEGAPVEGAHEAVPTHDTTAETPENTEGAQDGATAEAEGAEPETEESREEKSRNERRREAKERLQREAKEAREAKDAATRDAEEAKARERDALDRLRQVQDAARKLPPLKLEDFGGDYDRYQAELSARAFAQTLDGRHAQMIQAEALAARQAAENASKQAKAAQEAEEVRFIQYISHEGPSRFPDFMAVAGSDETPLNRDVMRLLSITDDPVGVSYWLGQNRDKAKELAALVKDGSHQATARAAKMLGGIDAFVSAPPKPPVTSAPAPISPVKPKASPVKDPGTMSYGEFKAWRASQR